ncbi:unnamed protein product [Bursaphelenchus okinawaensis]|uniref:NodB homology domain-containing protein n=1 Tax=Bursaphelenchus okinawaensis TaxID=465554 RepID=A0A811LJX0_9BILA|nr:unnamed protein product [Bursaphelenchus okinawaensis]CAG9124446.1 unnamed protein product [Bursaphelenchus okinawaensis]
MFPSTTTTVAPTSPVYQHNPYNHPTYSTQRPYVATPSYDSYSTRPTYSQSSYQATRVPGYDSRYHPEYEPRNTGVSTDRSNDQSRGQSYANGQSQYDTQNQIVEASRSHQNSQSRYGGNQYSNQHSTAQQSDYRNQPNTSQQNQYHSQSAQPSHAHNYQHYPPNRHAAVDCPVDPQQCKLPDCFCSRTGLDIPGAFDVADIPQMVLLSFNGPVNDRVINRLKAIFDGKYRNPNRCRIGGTLFANHVHNNYDQTQWLLSHGVEIGLSSMSSDNMSTAYERKWYDELNGMKAALEKFSYANRSAIAGVRAPKFESSGDSQMRTLTHLGYKYDSSLLVKDGPFWPQTLDYRAPWECESTESCVRDSHVGLWEVPVVPYHWNDKSYLKLEDMAGTMTKVEDLVKALKENFEAHEEANRAPMHIVLTAGFLNMFPDAGVINALQQFISEILKKDYVYFVSTRQAIDWISQPTRLSKLHNFRPWSCRRSTMGTIQPCENPSVCTFMNTRQGGPTPHSFKVCGSCPNVYPWLDDPTGSGIGKK